jgi:hypothetical protein
MQLRIETVINVIQAVFCVLKWLNILDWGWQWVLTPLWAGWIYMTVVVSLMRLRDKAAYRRHQKLVAAQQAEKAANKYRTSLEEIEEQERQAEQADQQEDEKRPNKPQIPPVRVIKDGGEQVEQQESEGDDEQDT